jgi:hypothetical protein
VREDLNLLEVFQAGTSSSAVQGRRRRRTPDKEKRNIKVFIYMKKKIFSLLALLLTAATGAWADSFSTDPYEANATLNNVTVSADMEITINKEVIVTVNNGVNIQNGATLTVNGPGKLVVNGATNSTAVSGSIIVNGATVQATGGQGYQGSNGNNGANGGNYPLDGDGQPGGTGVTGGTGGAAFSGTVTIYKGLIIATGGNGGRGGNGGNGGNGYSAFDKGGNGGNGGNGGQGGVAFSGQLTVYGGNVNAIGGAAGLAMEALTACLVKRLPTHLQTSKLRRQRCIAMQSIRL